MGNTLEKVCTVKVILVFCFLFLSLFLLFLSPSNRPILILHYFFSQFFPFLFFLRSKIISILSFTAITFVVCPSLLPYLLILIYYWFTLWFFSISFSFALISPFDFFFFLSLILSYLALLSPLALFYLLEIPVTLDLFCKDHKAVRPLGR